jgi:hypothetical protein
MSPLLVCALVLAGDPGTLPAPIPALPAPDPAPGRVTPPGPSPTLPASPPAGAFMSGKLELKTRGAFIVTFSRNSGTLVPGSFVFYALPSAVSEPQFFVSPENTILGFGLSGISVGDARLTGDLDVTLRSPTPLSGAPHTIAPQFYRLSIQLEGETWRVILGQHLDVMLPLVPDTANSFPSGYVPGAIGYARPQLRTDLRFPIGERFQILAKASANQAIQTFDLSDEAVGRQGGWPDGQARVSFAVGQSKVPWERPFEIGVAGHLGGRRVTYPETLMTVGFRTWSVAGDLRLRLPFGLLIKGRLWTGAAMGDYVGGIFQTYDLGLARAVRASGCWAEIQQTLNERWRVAIGYGRDDPRDGDVSAGGRTLNHAAFANLFFDAIAWLGFAAEASRWETSYQGLGAAGVWRGDVLFVMRF